MVSSFLSSITLIGQPAEAFVFGPQLVYFGISSFIVIPIIGYVFAPFFQEKKYMSAYDVSDIFYSMSRHKESVKPGKIFGVFENVRLLN